MAVIVPSDLQFLSLEIEPLKFPKSSLRRSLHLLTSLVPVIDPLASILQTCRRVTQGLSLVVHLHLKEVEVSHYKKLALHAFHLASIPKILPCANNSKGVWIFGNNNFE